MATMSHTDKTVLYTAEVS